MALVGLALGGFALWEAVMAAGAVAAESAALIGTELAVAGGVAAAEGAAVAGTAAAAEGAAIAGTAMAAAEGVALAGTAVAAESAAVSGALATEGLVLATEGVELSSLAAAEAASTALIDATAEELAVEGLEEATFVFAEEGGAGAQLASATYIFPAGAEGGLGVLETETTYTALEASAAASAIPPAAIAAAGVTGVAATATAASVAALKKKPQDAAAEAVGGEERVRGVEKSTDRREAIRDASNIKAQQSPQPTTDSKTNTVMDVATVPQSTAMASDREGATSDEAQALKDEVLRGVPESVREVPELVSTLDAVASNTNLDLATRTYIANEVVHSGFTASQLIESQAQYRYAVYASSAYEQSDDKIRSSVEAYLSDTEYVPELSPNVEKVKVFAIRRSGGERGKRKYVVAIKGTNPLDLQDLSADLLIGLGLGVRTTALYADAMDAYTAIKKRDPEAIIEFTGHSLGGTIAATAARTTNSDAVVFNMGSSPADVLGYPFSSTDTKTKSKIYHFRNAGDVVSVGAASHPTIKTKTVHSPGFLSYISTILGHDMLQFLPAASIKVAASLRELALNYMDAAPHLTSSDGGTIHLLPDRYASDIECILSGECIFNSRTGKIESLKAKKRKR